MPDLCGEHEGAERGAAGDATIPDIVVHCGPDRNRTFIADPLVVLEVLSRSTMDYDRGPKLAFYKGLPSLRHITLIYQDQMRVEHYYRAEDGWFLQSLTRTSQTLSFDGLDFSIGLQTIYFDVPMLRNAEPSDPSEIEPAGPVRPSPMTRELALTAVPLRPQPASRSGAPSGA